MESWDCRGSEYVAMRGVGECVARVYERSPCETMGHFALESPFLYLKYNPESALFQDGIIHKETAKSLCTPQMDEKAKLCYNKICWGALDAPAEMEDAPSMETVR